MNNLQPDKVISIRELRGVGEMVTAESLQRSVWASSTDFDHKDILIAIQHSGGLVAGAFTPDESLVGFIWHFPPWNFTDSTPIGWLLYQNIAIIVLVKK